MDNIDISLIYEELHYNGRSILPVRRPSSSPTDDAPTPFLPFAAHPVCIRPALTRWDFSEPLSILNCVVMEVKDVERHERECGLAVPEATRKNGKELWGEEVERGVMGVREEALKILAWRERQGKATF